MTQNFNRYTYGLNNPLAYVDENGEFWHLIIGALIGGVVNWAMNGFQFNAKGLGYFAVGALSGALGAWVGAGISSALAGGSFGAGFIGSKAALTIGFSFFTGAAIGGGAGAASGFTGGFGNALVGGKNIGQAFRSGLIGGGMRLASGAILGGLISGIDATLDGRNFGDGSKSESLFNIEQSISSEYTGRNNCLPDSGVAIDKSLGESGFNQNDFRNWVNSNSSPENDPLRVGDFWTKYSQGTGRSVTGMTTDFQFFGRGNTSMPVRFGDIMSRMSSGERISLGFNNLGSNVGHSTVLKSISVKLFTKINGNSFIKNFYRIMSPGQGFRTIVTKGIGNLPSNLNSVIFVR